MTSPNPAASYFTPKLGLQVDSLDDEMDSARENWDRLDNAQGALWVAAGVMPDDSQLYDGAVVAELTTGKVWRAQKDTNGIFRKHWIKFPWLLVASFKGPFGAHDAVNHEWGYNTVDTAASVNATISDVSGGRAVVPIDGVYAMVDIMRWEGAGASPGGIRTHKIVIGTLSYEETETIELPGFNNQAINQAYYTATLKAGDTVVANCWQTAPADQPNTTHFLYLACVRPT